MKKGRLKEVLIDRLDPAQWVTVEKTGGLRLYKFWENDETGATICLLDVPKGARIPIRHTHASNQFMYCIEGEYEYLEPKPGLVLKPGSFYMNPKDNPHGPTIARTRCLLLEIYDGAHYYATPSFHTDATVGRIAGQAEAKRRPNGKAARPRPVTASVPGRATPASPAGKSPRSAAKKAVKRGTLVATTPGAKKPVKKRASPARARAGR